MLANKSLSFDSFRLSITSVVILCGDHVIRWYTDKNGEYTGDAFKQLLLRNGYHTGNCGNLHAAIGWCVQARLSNSLQYGSPPPHRQRAPAQVVGGDSCSRWFTSVAVCRTPDLTWKLRSSGCVARRPISHTSRSSGQELSSTSRMTRNWNPSPGKGFCAASAQRKPFPAGSICIVITYLKVGQPGKVVSPARGQLNRENEYSP